MGTKSSCLKPAAKWEGIFFEFGTVVIHEFGKTVFRQGAQRSYTSQHSIEQVCLLMHQ